MGRWEEAGRWLQSLGSGDDVVGAGKPSAPRVPPTLPPCAPPRVSPALPPPLCPPRAPPVCPLLCPPALPPACPPRAPHGGGGAALCPELWLVPAWEDCELELLLSHVVIKLQCCKHCILTVRGVRKVQVTRVSWSPQHHLIFCCKCVLGKDE